MCACLLVVTGALYHQSPGHKAATSPGQQQRRSKQVPNDSPALSPAPTSFTLHVQVPAASGEAYQQLAVCWTSPGVNEGSFTITAPEGTHSTVVTSSGARCSSDGYGSYSIGRTYNLCFNHVIITAEAPPSPPHSPISPCPLTAAAPSPTSSSKALPPFSSSEPARLTATQGQDASAGTQQLTLTAGTAATGVTGAAAQTLPSLQKEDEPGRVQRAGCVPPALSLSTMSDCEWRMRLHLLWAA